MKSQCGCGPDPSLYQHRESVAAAARCARASDDRRRPIRSAAARQRRDGDTARGVACSVSMPSTSSSPGRSPTRPGLRFGPTRAALDRANHPRVLNDHRTVSGTAPRRDHVRCRFFGSHDTSCGARFEATSSCSRHRRVPGRVHAAHTLCQTRAPSDPGVMRTDVVRRRAAGSASQ